MNRNPKAEVLLLENQHELKINGKKDAGSQCIEIYAGKGLIILPLNVVISSQRMLEK
jgi:hypothetical protein